MYDWKAFSPSIKIITDLGKLVFHGFAREPWHSLLRKLKLRKKYLFLQKKKKGHITAHWFLFLCCLVPSKQLCEIMVTSQSFSLYRRNTDFYICSPLVLCHASVPLSVSPSSSSQMSMMFPPLHLLLFSLFLPIFFFFTCLFLAFLPLFQSDETME